MQRENIFVASGSLSVPVKMKHRTMTLSLVKIYDSFHIDYNSFRYVFLPIEKPGRFKHLELQLIIYSFIFSFLRSFNNCS